MTICQLVISGNKFCRDFHRFFEIKVIGVIPVCIRLRNVNLKTLPTSRTLKLSLKPISLAHKVFSASFLHKKMKNRFNANFLSMGLYSQSAIQTDNYPQ